MNRFKSWIIPSLVVAVLVTSLVGFRDDDVFFLLKKNYTIFGKIFEELAVGYVDPLDPTHLMRSGIDEMMGGLDPYTVYFDETANEDMNINARGGFGTVGVGVGIRAAQKTVVDLMEGFPGVEQGVHIGDIILQIDGNPVDDLSVSDVAELLSGDPGTTIRLRVRRTGEPNPLDFVLVRQPMVFRNMTYAGFVDNDSTRGIGYVRFSRFGRGGVGEIVGAVKQMESTGKLKSLVLDLRGNPGGLLDQAIAISALFVPEGSKIVSTRGRDVTSERAFSSNSAPLFPDLPLSVLIDGASASASEIVSGAIQDLDRGVVVGETSFGKGLVQTIRPLPYGTSMKFTSARYYIPSGRSIQAINYAARDENGDPLPVPDSLRRDFKTANGRLVRDGRGVEPDISVPSGPVSELEKALLRQSAFFLFANRFAADRESIKEDFQITDRIYNEFVDWTKQQGLSYSTRSEHALERFQHELTEAGYQDVERDAAKLVRQIESEKARDFTRHQNRIKRLLLEEILKRYVDPAAAIRLTMSDDPQLDEAVRILENSRRYAQILGRD